MRLPRLVGLGAQCLLHWASETRAVDGRVHCAIALHQRTRVTNSSAPRFFTRRSNRTRGRPKTSSRCQNSISCCWSAREMPVHRANRTSFGDQPLHRCGQFVALPACSAATLHTPLVACCLCATSFSVEKPTPERTDEMPCRRPQRGGSVLGDRVAASIVLLEHVSQLSSHLRL